MTKRSLRGPRLVVPFKDWPPIDQELWNAGHDPGDGFDDPGYAVGLRPATLRNAVKGYGRWLAVLATNHTLDPSMPPASRVTPGTARTFLDALREAGNTNNTIIARFFDLRTALRVMQPDVDTQWLTAPNGQSLHRLLPVERRSFEVPDSRTLYNWGLDVMTAAPEITAPLERAARHRDGLLIALLAARGLRSRTVAAMRIGRHIRPHGKGFRLVFEAEDLKVPRPIEYGLPASLTPAVRHYLDVERPILLGDQVHDWFWVGQQGARLQEAGIDRIIRHASEEEFGGGFGVHRFRHAIGTTAPIADPTRPAYAAALLGHSAGVLEEYYNIGRREIAADRFHDTLRTQREETRLLARRLFGDD